MSVYNRIDQQGPLPSFSLDTETSSALPSYDFSGGARYPNNHRRRQSHVLSIEDAEQIPWATLRVSSFAPSIKSLPVYFEGQPVTGEVRIDPQKLESIKSVTVLIEGLMCVGFNETPFMSLSRTLWDASQESPRSPGSLHNSSFTTNDRDRYSWNFAISLPSRPVYDEKIVRKLALTGSDSLPPHFTGVKNNIAINYRLTLRIKRRGVLKPVNSLATLFGFTPLSRPSAPSPARQKSYEENAPIQGPLKDPSGWHVLQDIRVTGSLFRQRMITANYVVAFALPLTYTRGTVIPCLLRVRSSDQHALDLLSGPQAPKIVLRRSLETSPNLSRNHFSNSIAAGNSIGDETLRISQAIWAPASSGTVDDFEGEDCRVLLGELDVPPSCTPSFAFGSITLKYFVDVYLPSPAGFEPEHPDVVANLQVTIASAHAEESVRPRAYITPAHDVSRRVAEADAGASRAQYYIAQRNDEHRDPPTSTGASPIAKKGRRFSLLR